MQIPIATSNSGLLPWQNLPAPQERPVTEFTMQLLEPQ